MRDVAVLLISIHHPCTFGDADLQHVAWKSPSHRRRIGGVGESDSVAGISVCPSALTLPHSRSPLSSRTPETETIALPSKLFGVLVIVARACSGRWVGGVLLSLSLSPPYQYSINSFPTITFAELLSCRSLSSDCVS